MNVLIKRRGKFTRWLRRRDINNLRFVNNREIATECSNTLVFVGRRQYYKLCRHGVRSYSRGDLQGCSMEKFYRDLLLAIEQVRGMVDHGFEEAYDHEDDSYYLKFKGNWCYESDLLGILEAMKYEYSNFINGEIK